MWLGSGTTPGHGTCPGTIQIHTRSHAIPKLAGFTFFSAICASRANTCLKKKKRHGRKNGNVTKKKPPNEWTIRREFTHCDLPAILIKCCKISEFDLLSQSTSISFPSSVDKCSTINRKMQTFAARTHHKSIEWTAMGSYFLMSSPGHLDFYIAPEVNSNGQIPCKLYKNSLK